jgi:hypothetical protein
MGRSFNTQGGSVVSFAGAELLSALQPGTLDTDVDNYNPPNNYEASLLLLSASAAINITGLANAVNNRVVNILNVGAFNITLKDASGSSSAANRFRFGADVVLNAFGGVQLLGNTALSGWILLQELGASGGGSRVELTPPAIAGTVNDYNPAGWDLGGITDLYLNPTGNQVMTGLKAQTGQITRIWNVNAFGSKIGLVPNSGASAAANRFNTPDALQFDIHGGGGALIAYDNTNSLWRTLAQTTV